MMPASLHLLRGGDGRGGGGRGRTKAMISVAVLTTIAAVSIMLLMMDTSPGQHGMSIWRMMEQQVWSLSSSKFHLIIKEDKDDSNDNSIDNDEGENVKKKEEEKAGDFQQTSKSVLGFTDSSSSSLSTIQQHPSSTISQNDDDDEIKEEGKQKKDDDDDDDDDASHDYGGIKEDEEDQKNSDDDDDDDDKEDHDDDHYHNIENTNMEFGTNNIIENETKIKNSIIDNEKDELELEQEEEVTTTTNNNIYINYNKGRGEGGIGKEGKNLRRGDYIINHDDDDGDDTGGEMMMEKNHHRHRHSFSSQSSFKSITSLTNIIPFLSRKKKNEPNLKSFQTQNYIDNDNSQNMERKNRLLQGDSGGGVDDGDGTSSTTPSTICSDISDSFRTSYLLLLVGNATLITEQQLNLVATSFATSYNDERSGSSSGGDASINKCDPFFRKITEVDIATNFSFNGINNKANDDPFIDIPLIPVRRRKLLLLSSSNYFYNSNNNNENTIMHNGMEEEWSSSFSEFQLIMKNIEDENENDNVKHLSGWWTGPQEQERQLQQQQYQELNSTALERFPVRSLLMLVDIVGTCRACQGGTEAFDLFDDIVVSSAPIDRRQRHLQEDQGNNNDCVCPADSVIVSGNSAAAEFQSSLNGKIDELRDSGEIDFVEEVDDVVPVLETKCPTKDQDFSFVYLVRDVVFSKSLLLSLGVEGARKVERLFRHSYNSVARELCDSLYRSISQVQLVSIDQEEESKVRMEFIVQATCRGEGCTKVGCIFDEVESCEVEQRRERSLKKTYVEHPQKGFAPPNGYIESSNIMTGFVNSITDDVGDRPSRWLQEEDNEEDNNDEGNEERCFCKKNRSNRPPTQDEFTAAFQEGLDRITEADAPTMPPTGSPSESGSPTLPSTNSTGWPSDFPSYSPTVPPSSIPTKSPSETPSDSPSMTPSMTPSVTPTTTFPTTSPSVVPSTTLPSVTPTMTPSEFPSTVPSDDPSSKPSMSPTTTSPSVFPTPAPTQSPSYLPSISPSWFPSVRDDCLGISCGPGGTCIDEVDTYSCVCNIGYENSDQDDTTSPCMDIDECLRLGSPHFLDDIPNPYPCLPNRECVNTEGSSTCTEEASGSGLINGACLEEGDSPNVDHDLNNRQYCNNICSYPQIRKLECEGLELYSPEFCQCITEDVPNMLQNDCEWQAGNRWCDIKDQDTIVQCDLILRNDYCDDCSDICGGGTCSNLATGGYDCSCNDDGFVLERCVLECSEISATANSFTCITNPECSRNIVSTDESICIDPCDDALNICPNGVCTMSDTDDTGYTCNCDFGYEFHAASNSCVSKCDSSPCGDGVGCFLNVEEWQGFGCDCLTDDYFNGITCVPNLCNDPSICAGGTCTNIFLTEGYDCSCNDDGFVLERCVSDCAASAADSNSFECITDPECSRNLLSTDGSTTCFDPCDDALNICPNGECTRFDTGYKCECNFGYEFNAASNICVSTCDSSPCGVGATCFLDVDQGQGYGCNCPANSYFNGMTCVDFPCNDASLCDGGTCTNNIAAATYDCSCNVDGYVLERCVSDCSQRLETQNFFECTTDPECSNNLLPTDGSSSTCIDPCLTPNICPNGACTTSTTSYECICNTGYVNTATQHCVSICDTSPCGPDGVVECSLGNPPDFPQGYGCTCQTGFYFNGFACVASDEQCNSLTATDIDLLAPCPSSWPMDPNWPDACGVGINPSDIVCRNVGNDSGNEGPCCWYTCPNDLFRVQKYCKEPCPAGYELDTTLNNCV